MKRNKIIGLVCLSIFAMMQISACFVAGNKTEGVVSVFFYVLGGISCLFGATLDFLLLVLAMEVFGSVFGTMASRLGGKDGDEEEIEVIDVPE